MVNELKKQLETVQDGANEDLKATIREKDDKMRGIRVTDSIHVLTGHFISVWERTGVIETIIGRERDWKTKQSRVTKGNEGEWLYCRASIYTVSW